MFERLNPPHSQKSNADELTKLSLSVYVANFPSHLTVRELWNICGKMGTLVDVYITKRKNHLGQMFTFCRYIKVFDSKILIDSLSDVWIGKLRLHANVARFDRNVVSKPSHAGEKDSIDLQPKNPYLASEKADNVVNMGTNNSSFASVLNARGKPKNFADSARTIVLDDECIMERDLSCALMGKIKDINALSNLYVILTNEGFGVASWFIELLPATNSFVSNVHLVWISVEGSPIKSWTSNTFAKIVSRWGVFSDVDIADDSSLPFNRLCVVTKPHIIINDTIKVIIKGQAYWIRIKELEAWSPDFNNEFCEDSSSDDESVDEEVDHVSDTYDKDANFDKEKEADFVLDSTGKNDKGVDDLDKEKKDGYVKSSYDMNVNGAVLNNHGSSSKLKPNSKDPFGIYELLNRNKNKQDSKSEDLIFPPGFTLNAIEDTDVGNLEHNINQPNASLWSNMEVGQTMGYNMEGCLKNIEAIINPNETFSPSIGYSDGLLCVWDPTMFFKDSVTISDSFLAFRGDFNEVRSEHERFGTMFNASGANAFNHFISSAGLVDLPLEGYSYTWALKSASKMSKLDGFLIYQGLLSVFSSLSAICLDRNLSDHRPILMRYLVVDYGPTPFRVFNSWFTKDGFDKLVEDSWKTSTFMESNNIYLLKTKYKALKESIKYWCKADKQRSNESKYSIQSRISEIDKLMDKGKSNEDLANIHCAIEGDENSKYFHGIINKKRSQLAIRGVLVDGEWIDDPSKNVDLESNVTYEEIKKAIWDCSTNKSPGPDGFTFYFFTNIRRPLIKMCFYKIIAKIMANRLSFVISDLIRDDQSPFISNRHILDGPFILNELISWCKYNKTKAMIFKVDFEKAFDSIRWDYLDDILDKFGFGAKWRGWIHGCLNSSMGSILFNGSLTFEFKFHKGLNQRDPLSLFLFILVMESLHLSFNNILNACLFKGIRINGFFTLSRLFYVDDVFSLVNGIKRISSLLCVKVWTSTSRSSYWDEVLAKISARLSKWKIKTLSIDYGSLDNPGYNSHRSLWYNIIREFKTLSLKDPPRGGIEEDQLGLLIDKLAPVILTNSNDRWIWSLDSAGEFSAKSARSFINDSLLPSVGAPTRWLKVVSIKINIFAWKNPKTSQSKNKGLVAETFDWNEEEVSNDEEMTQVKVPMGLANDELAVGKNHARNGEWIDITMRKVSNDPESSKDSKSESLTLLPILKNLQGAFPSSKVMSLTYQSHSLKGEKTCLGIMKHTKPKTHESSSKSVSGPVTINDTEPVTPSVPTEVKNTEQE
uniref:Reverse transcriptase domain-containing protein n=1 Tax=Tanacetum cinerariifolium TaxID=118510 RepID=A0A6L2KRP2_TANCI|nr:hypothetical protein [Tanacetum cinerariifolium]